MTRSKRKVALPVLFAMFIAACERASNAPETMNRGTAGTVLELKPNPPPDNPLHAIVLPHAEPLFRPGPGREEFMTACVVCHSPRYITMQPGFSRSTWLSEVNKMKDNYGAHISAEQVAKIADYLVFVNGKADTGQAPEGTYGE